MKVKTRTTDSEWREAVRNIENIVSKEYIDNLSRDTFEYAKNTMRGKSVISWSGGKDSIVLEHVLRPLGLDSIFAYCDLEYPMFLEWVRANAPARLHFINSGQDLTWLSKHDEMLFPDNSKKAGRWYDIVQHKAQNKFIKEQNINTLILGRRRADGNFCGSQGYYMKKDCLIFSPLYMWRHEDILAYIHYNELPLPPIYDLPDGYKQGTHNWASYILYDGMTRAQALDRLWNIDKNIIINAKDHIPAIEEWYNDNRKTGSI